MTVLPYIPRKICFAKIVLSQVWTEKDSDMVATKILLDLKFTSTCFALFKLSIFQMKVWSLEGFKLVRKCYKRNRQLYEIT